MKKTMKNWKFVEELKRYQEPYLFAGKLFESAIKIRSEFPDPECLLDTAYEALKRLNTGPLLVTVVKIKTAQFEDYTIETSPGKCHVASGDTEGVRRGIYLLIDILKSCAPSQLPEQTRQYSAWLKTRISRCFFGPIKRPPLYRDELLDECDYYPDNYLDRLASEGVNGLWLSVELKDLCRTRFTPDAAPDMDRRFAKLQRTIDKCRRYGIKIYLFCNEPESWEFESGILREYPSLEGPCIFGRKCFCPFSQEGREYLYDSLYQIFSNTEHLGGMINICLGEGITTCLSSVDGINDPGGIQCISRCNMSNKEIMYSALDAMSRGMHDAAPDAEFISWFYLPFTRNFPEWVYETAETPPEKVIPQLNFESGVEVRQLGKIRYGGDYWLSVSAPSENYVRFARSARRGKTPVSAKIQVGCSHEVATVPFVPVPGLLYRKYKAMHELGVSRVMQCWYFGNYPGIMNRAAGKLAFQEFTGMKKTFLGDLAKAEWGEYADAAAEGWELLAEAYENYPVSNMFQYFGPVADGVTWPLYLYPANRRLFPTWLLSDELNGDNICECLENHSLDEAVSLMGKVAERWNGGTAVFAGLKEKFADNPERLRDIWLIQALGIQFASAFNILRFYQLRRQLFSRPVPNTLTVMRQLVEHEIMNRKQLLPLVQNDSRLGFHSEAEGYKYDYGKIKKSISMLEKLFMDDFPRAERDIRREAPFKVKSREFYRFGADRKIDCGAFSWSAGIEGKKLVIGIECRGINPVLDEIFLGIDDHGNSFPCLLHVCSNGKKYVVPDGAQCRINSAADKWHIALQLPEKSLPGADFSNLRLNIIRFMNDYLTAHSWPHHCTLNEGRLNLVFYDPANMGDLLYVNSKRNKIRKTS